MQIQAKASQDVGDAIWRSRNRGYLGCLGILVRGCNSGMTASTAAYLFRVCSVVAVVEPAHAVNVPIRIVKEVASYGTFGNNFAPSLQETPLLAATRPENFSGPSQLQRLVGKCFNYTAAEYRYTLCPFQNVTQIEESYRWNAYRGVLGVWQEWKIINNTFSAMLYTHGDRCGDRNRSVEVKIQCGEQNTLVNVSEPNRCYYTGVLVTPLACHRDALLVYPRLPSELRRRWDAIEGELFDEELTEKGYEAELRKLFVDAGFVKPEEKPESPLKQSVQGPSSNGMSSSKFSDVMVCSAAYEQLQREIEGLRRTLEAYQNGTKVTTVRSSAQRDHSR